MGFNRFINPILDALGFDKFGVRRPGGDTAEEITQTESAFRDKSIPAAKIDGDVSGKVVIEVGGAEVGSEHTVNLIPGQNVDIQGADDPAGGKVDVTIGAKTTVQAEGMDIATEPKVNFKAGANVTLTVTDNPMNNSVDVEIASTGGGGGGGGIDGINFVTDFPTRSGQTPIAIDGGIATNGEAFQALATVTNDGSFDEGVALIAADPGVANIFEGNPRITFAVAGASYNGSEDLMWAYIGLGDVGVTNTPDFTLPHVGVKFKGTGTNYDTEVWATQADGTTETEQLLTTITLGDILDFVIEITSEAQAVYKYGVNRDHNVAVTVIGTMPSNTATPNSVPIALAAYGAPSMAVNATVQAGANFFSYFRGGTGSSGGSVGGFALGGQFIDYFVPLTAGGGIIASPTSLGTLEIRTDFGDFSDSAVGGYQHAQVAFAYKGNPSYSWNAWFDEIVGDNTGVTLYIGAGVPGTTAGDPDLTAVHAGFKFVGLFSATYAPSTMALYATQGDGVAETASAQLATINFGDKIELMVSVLDDTSVSYRYRLNGVLSDITTLSTNAPPSATDDGLLTSFMGYAHNYSAPSKIQAQAISYRYSR